MQLFVGCFEIGIFDFNGYVGVKFFFVLKFESEFFNYGGQDCFYFFYIDGVGFKCVFVRDGFFFNIGYYWIIVNVVCFILDDVVIFVECGFQYGYWYFF